MTTRAYSKNGLLLTESFEGCKLAAYQDQVGMWTIGFGHTRDVEPGMICTQSQAEQWLLEDAGECVSWLNNFVTPRVELTQGEFDALVDFSFNVGLHALSGATLLKDVLADKMALAADEFEKWDRAGGQVVAGLLRRRLAEKEEFIA
ncbi:MAG TPA: lysozyme [Methylophilaceae bacterium]|jgi:lysozyme